MRDITLEETVYFNFTTRSFSTGVPATLSGTPALSVLESNNATPITAGVSVAVDRATVTGLNQATVVATAANGYEAGKSYSVYISTGTVGGVSVVGEVVAQFTVQSAASFTRLGAPAGASIAADLLAIDNFVDGIESTLASGVELSATAVDAIWDESLAAHQTALTAGRALTLGGVPIAETTVTGTPSTTSIQLTAGSTIDNYYNNQTLVIASGSGAGQARVILDYTGATRTCTFDEAFVTAPAASDAVFVKANHVHPLSEIAGAVWDEVLTGATHNVTNSAGRRLRLIDAAFEVHAGTAQAGSTSTTFVMDTGASTTNNIYNGDRIIITAGTGAEEHGIVISYVGATRTATMSKAWVITPDNTSEFAVVPADCDIETWNHVAVTGDGDWAELQTDVDAILVDTAEIGAAGAGLTALATQASVNVIDDFLDTEIAAIKAKTDSLTFTVAGQIDSNILAVNGDTDAVTRLERVLSGNTTGTVGAASTTTSIVTSAMSPAAAVIDQFKGKIVSFDAATTTAALRGQSTDITASTALGVLTVTALTTAPVSGDTFTVS